MSLIKVKYEEMQEAKLRKATDGSAGYDIAANDTVVIPRGCKSKVTTGVALEVPENMYAELVPRSSSGNKGYRLANTMGIIDSDFRGYIDMYIENTGSAELIIYPGDYLCQLIFKKKEKVTFKEVKELNETARGDGGFGSTDELV